jgi:PST family polysaccharide transporter
MSKYIVWIQNGCVLAFAPIKIILILNGKSLMAFVWISAIEGMVVACLTFLMLGLKGIKIYQMRFSFICAKKLLLDSWPLLMSVVAISIYMKIDQIMLGQMVGDDAVGIYSAAVRISEVWYFIPLMISASVFPSILEAKKRDEIQYKKRLQRLYDLMVWISITIAIPMTFLSTTVINILYGSSYSEAGVVLAIHIWASVFVFLGVASGQYFIAENRQILSFQRTAIGALINITLNFILIPDLGVVGAAIATVISQAIVGLFYDVIQNETRTMFYMKMKAFNPNVLINNKMKT